ncbi:hypothetical protein AHAS_Ahas13G0528600 [Arachis hypogaea]
MKTEYKRLKGRHNFRQLLLLATLSSTPIIIDDISADETWPGLHNNEISLLRLFQTVSYDCLVQINETGTKLKYKPGIIMGCTQHHPHAPLILLGLFAKKPLAITLKGITNDSKDPSVDTFKSTALPMLKRFGVPAKGLSLKIESRGVPPNGGGEVVLSLPVVQGLFAMNWTDEGFVKKIRGITFSTKVSAQFENRMIRASRGIFNPLLSDVHIFHGSAETTTGCLISADTVVSHARHEETSGLEDDSKKNLMPPDDVGSRIANILLGEIAQGGVVIF